MATKIPLIYLTRLRAVIKSASAWGSVPTSPNLVQPTNVPPWHPSMGHIPVANMGQYQLPWNEVGQAGRIPHSGGALLDSAADISKYVEPGVQAQVRGLNAAGNTTYMSNHAGPGARGTWYRNPAGAQMFAPLEAAATAPKAWGTVPPSAPKAWGKVPTPAPPSGILQGVKNLLAPVGRALAPVASFASKVAPPLAVADTVHSLVGNDDPVQATRNADQARQNWHNSGTFGKALQVVGAPFNPAGTANTLFGASHNPTAPPPGQSPGLGGNLKQTPKLFQPQAKPAAPVVATPPAKPVASVISTPPVKTAAEVGVLACDLDGTLAKKQEPFSIHTVGEPVQPILDYVKDELAKGRKVVCFTARAASKDPKMHKAVRDWLDKHGLQKLEITNEKTKDITEILDDRAVGITPNEGTLKTDHPVLEKAASDSLELQEKIAASYVRRTKLVEQHSDHCPHCDHEFSEKGYPRPDPDDEDPMTADSICPHCRGRIEQQELSDQEIDSTVEWLRPGMRKHRESLRARRERQSKQAAVNLVCWNSPETDTFDGELEKMAKSYPDKLKRLWLRQGKCPECGGAPVGGESDGEPECSKCEHTWTWAQAKEAAAKLTFEEKPAKRFMRPENWDPYDKQKFVTLYCGCNDWEMGQTWLWAEGEGKRAWIQLKFENGHPSYERVSDEMEAAFKKQYKAAQAMWDRCAGKEATITQYIDALKHKEMQPFILASGVDKLEEHEKQASVAPRTGPLAIAAALKNLNLDELEKQARADIATGKVTKREKGVRMLQAISGLRRNEMQPHELMISKVPVLPPAFRPFSLMGSTYIPGNANELYADLFKHRDIHKQTVKELGEAGGSLTRRNLLNAVRALYGYGDPVSPKLVERRTKGFLQEITGNSPKTGFFQRKLISKPLDSIGRGVITVDPDLGMNQISLPKDMAWTLYGSFVQRRLAQQGFSPFDAVKAVKDRTRDAELALQEEMKEGSGRPVIYSRAPSWHKFNTIGGWARIHDGDNVAINPYVTAGLGADFDGDQINVNVPIMDESVKETREKLMPDKMIFSIRNQDQVMGSPKHESILGLFAPSVAPAKRLHRFGSKQEALAAAKRGDVGLSDEIEYPDD